MIALLQPLHRLGGCARRFLAPRRGARSREPVPFPKKALFEALEQRILLSADLPGVAEATDGVDPDAITAAAEDLLAPAAPAVNLTAFTPTPAGASVVASSPAGDTDAPIRSFVFTFDRPLDAATADVDDVVSFTGPGGVDLIADIFAAYASGNDFTVEFYDQLARGAYTMVIGPGIADESGNLMDQDGNGVGGEATDAFTAAVSVHTADLAVTEFLAPESASPGDEIEVSWTVENRGDAVAGGTSTGRTPRTSTATC